MFQIAARLLDQKMLTDFMEMCDKSSLKTDDPIQFYSLWKVNIVASFL